jgi:preprotein translocase subunit SecE
MARSDGKPNIFQKLRRWWRETIGELRKVTWPTWKEALSLTRIVLIVTVIMAAILGLLDFVFSRLVGLLIT